MLGTRTYNFIVYYSLYGFGWELGYLIHSKRLLYSVEKAPVSSLVFVQHENLYVWGRPLDINSSVTIISAGTRLTDPSF